MLKFNNLIPHHFGKKDLVEGEKIVAIVHRHPFYLIKKIIFPTILFIIIWILTISAIVYINNNISEEYKNIIYLILAFIVFIIHLFITFKILYALVDHKFDNLIITSRRCVWIDRHFIYGQTVREITLDKITTVRSECNNFIANMLGFARLDIDSADEGQHIVFNYAPKVAQIRSLISKVKDDYDERSHHVETNNDETQEQVVTNNDQLQENNPVLNTDKSNELLAVKQELELLKNEYNLLNQKVQLLEQNIQNFYSQRQ